MRPSALAAGLLVGLAAVGASVPHLKMAGGEGTLGLDLRLTADVPAELSLTGDDLMINARRLMPGTRHHDQHGSATFANQTGSPLIVHVTAIPSSPQMASRVMISMRVGNRRIAHGTLAQVHRGHAWFRIPRGGSRRIRARVWLPASVHAGYAGVLQDVALDLRATPAPAPPAQGSA